MLLVLIVGAPAAAVTTLKGAGADSADPLIGAWQKTVGAAPYSTPVDYSADGTSLGRSEWIDDQVDFAVTSVPFTTDEQAALTAKKKTFVYVPFTGGALAFLYHLNDDRGQPIKGLQLSGATLTGIFTGTITTWNDPAILADNPGADAAREAGRADRARSARRGHLHGDVVLPRCSAPAVWKSFMEDPQRNFPDEARELFPFFNSSDSRTSSFSVCDVVRANEGSDGRITYVDAAWALPATDEGADIAKIKNAAGTYVLPTPAAAAAALSAWKTDATTHLLTPDYAVTAPTAYPVVMVNYLVVPTSGLSAETAASLSTFAHYGLREGAGRRVHGR